MIITSIAGQYSETSEHEADIEYVYLDSEECPKKRFRTTTDKGTEVGIDLPPGPPLSEGDILYADNNRLIVVKVKPTDVIVAKPQTKKEMGELCYQIGNLHQPLLVLEDEVLIPDEKQNVDLFRAVGLPFRQEKRVLPQGFATKRTVHRHTHPHHHDDAMEHGA
ncbi:urease accessory protein UreE [Scopulibacillus cellulosilyticus]|uniref:Urease accessory protein UreE n=1 Tax=Scopulibacillus cellulosilyticus TaxID=2665665 RepID=A0ABW2PXU2_9BACL